MRVKVDEIGVADDMPTGRDAGCGDGGLTGREQDCAARHLGANGFSAWHNEIFGMHAAVKKTRGKADREDAQFGLVVSFDEPVAREVQ